jgi:acetyltransferase-like isoleucine patch superfamily enzyme
VSDSGSSGERAESGRLGVLGVVRWELTRWVLAAVAWIPGATGALVRTVVVRPLLGESRGPFRMFEHVFLEYPSRLVLGRNAGINAGCWINARGGVRIGDDAILGPYCIIHSANHRTSDASLPYREQGYLLASVSIGNNVWLGARVTVLPGTTIGDDAIVGAGAVVTCDIPPRTLALGVPARVVRLLDEEATSDASAQAAGPDIAG